MEGGGVSQTLKDNKALLPFWTEGQPLMHESRISDMLPVRFCFPARFSVCVTAVMVLMVY